VNIKKGLTIFIFILLLINVNVYALNRAVIDITQMDITDLSEALNKELITSEELVRLYLDRINEFDHLYNSIIDINDEAIEKARRLDEERASGNVRGIMHGIPIVVKGNIDVYGMRTTAGSNALRDNYPRQNAFAVQRLIDEGAIIIATTNLSAFGFRASSSISDFGRVNNAFNPAFTAHGSSGGTAVAVRAHFAAAGLGTDTNASVRSPAAANSLIGLRPTVGLVSRVGVLPYDVRRDTLGPITRTVQDSIIIMNIINAHDERDNQSINQDPVVYNPTMKNLEGITIGVPEAFIRGSNQNLMRENWLTYGPITSLMETALEKLEEQGATVVFIEEYWTGQTQNWYQTSLSGFTFCDGFNRYVQGTTGRIRSFSQLGFSTEFCNSSGNFTTQNNIKDLYRGYIENIMERYNLDVIAYPTNTNKLVRHGETDNFIGLSYHASSTINFPSIALPLGFDNDDLPYGIEFMAPKNREDLLFEIALIHERVNNHNINPDITPSLYEIPEVVSILVEKYRNRLTKELNFDFEYEWLELVRNYFRNYSENENYLEDAEALIELYEYNLVQSEMLTKNSPIKSFLMISGSIVVIFILFIIVFRVIKKLQ